MNTQRNIEKLMFGFIESQILYTCHNMGVFEYLSAYNTASCDSMSQTLSIPNSSLERLLSGAVCIGLLTTQSGNYSIAPEYQSIFDKTNPNYCGNLFGHYANASYKIFQYLESGVRENQAQWSKDGGSSVKNIYSDCIYTDENSSREFLNTMWVSGYKDSLELCQKYSFTDYHKLVDLGGATGSFAIAALKHNPQLHADILDLEVVKPFANEMFKSHEVSDRGSFVAGDMFNDDLPLGDIYVIGYVLSDWSDDKCISLIKKCYASLPKDGLIIVLEKHLDEDKSGPYLTTMMNLVMLLEMEGRHRCYSEYTSWLTDAGFTNIETIYSSNEKNMIIGKKC